MAFAHEIERTGAAVMPDETDEALVAATADGDMLAFERLHRKYYKRIFGFALRLTGRPDLAEEVVSDVLMVVWRSAAGFRGQSRPSTWIFGIAYRTAMKARGKRARDALNDEIDESMPAETTGPAEIERLFQARAVAAALRQLPEEQRVAIELTYYHGYKVTEIAEITGSPVGTVKTRMFHARAKLRTLLAEAAPQDGGGL